MEVDYLALAKLLGISGRIAGNQLYGKCPLHSDKSPSFSLNVLTGEWTCHWGCGPNGGRDFVKLVELVRGVSRWEARQWVKRGYKQPDAQQLRASIDTLLKQTAPLPLLAREETDEPSDAEAYFNGLNGKLIPLAFLRRGFSWETIARWDIRYDTIRDRVVIPVKDHRGKFHGTVSRLMNPPPGMGRYLNTPGMPKHQLLFGLWPQWTSRVIILVEGPLDAIWMQQNGWPAAATFGTELHPDQIALLHEHGIGEVILMMDNPEVDEGGRKALPKARQHLVEAGYLLNQIYTVQYPEPDAQRPKGYKDANDCTAEQIALMLVGRKLLI